MASVGSGELIMLVVIVLIVFSASRMSQLGDAVGRFVYSFKRAANGQDTIDVTPKPAPLVRGTEDARVIDATPGPGPDGGKPSA